MNPFLPTGDSILVSMSADVSYFLEFQETEKNASPLTVRNYSAALKKYAEWRGMVLSTGGTRRGMISVAIFMS